MHFIVSPMDNTFYTLGRGHGLLGPASAASTATQGVGSSFQARAAQFLNPHARAQNTGSARDARLLNIGAMAPAASPGIQAPITQMGSPFSGLTGRLAGGLAGGGLAGLAAGHGHNSPTIANLGQQQQPQNQSNVYDIGSPRDKEDSIGTARGRFAGMVGAGQGAAATSSTAAASGARREQWRGSSQWRGTSQQLLDWFDDDKAGVAEMGAADGLGGAGAWTGHSGAPPAAAGAADAAAAGPAMAPRTGAYDYDDVSGGGEPAGGEGGQAAAKQKGGWSHVQVSSLLKESMLEGMFSSSQRDGGFFRLQPQQVKQKVQAIYDQLLSSLQGEVADLQSKIKNSFQPEKGQLQATLAEKELHIANMKGLAARRQSSSDRTWYQLFCHIVSNTAHYT